MNPHTGTSAPHASLTRTGIGAVALLFCALVSACALEVRTREFDFGEVPEGRVVKLEEELRNDSAGILRVGIRPSCDCVTVSKNRFDIAPGSSETIAITVDTAGYAGDFLKQVFIQSNAQDDPYVAVVVRGNVAARASAPRSAEPAPAPQQRKNETVLPLVIFDSAGCAYCRELREGILPALEKTYRVSFAVKEYDVSVKGNYEKLLYLENLYGAGSSAFPVVFLCGDSVAGKSAIERMLPALVKKYAGPGPCKDIAVPGRLPSAADGAAGKLKLMPVIAAGLVDSINPCAFATIIFFLSYLSLVLKKKRSEVFLTGLVFIAGVFVSYLLIGIGFFKGLQSLSGVTVLSKAMYLVMGAVLLGFAGRSLYEAVAVLRRGRVAESDIKLGLPASLREKIYGIIQALPRTRYLVPFVFVSAAAITLLEFFCTGQVYLPTILYLVSLDPFHSAAVLYLLLYCLLFVAPLIVLFVLFYFGLTTEKIKRCFAGEVVYAKFAMAAFFFAMAALMFANF